MMSREDRLIPEFPMSIDLKITDKYKNGCPYCYESSSPDGEEADERILELVKVFPPYTEVTLGGGNPLESGLLERIIWECNANISFTVNQADIDRLLSAEWFKKLAKGHGMTDFLWEDTPKANVTAIGISVSHVDNVLIEKLKKLDEQIHIVVHAAAGVITLYVLKNICAYADKETLRSMLKFFDLDDKWEYLYEESQKHFAKINNSLSAKADTPESKLLVEYGRYFSPNNDTENEEHLSRLSDMASEIPDNTLMLAAGSDYSIA